MIWRPGSHTAMRKCGTFKILANQRLALENKRNCKLVWLGFAKCSAAAGLDGLSQNPHFGWEYVQKLVILLIFVLDIHNTLDITASVSISIYSMNLHCIGECKAKEQKLSEWWKKNSSARQGLQKAQVRSRLILVNRQEFACFERLWWSEVLYIECIKSNVNVISHFWLHLPRQKVLFPVLSHSLMCNRLEIKVSWF